MILKHDLDHSPWYYTYVVFYVSTFQTTLATTKHSETIVEKTSWRSTHLPTLFSSERTPKCPGSTAERPVRPQPPIRPRPVRRVGRDQRGGGFRERMGGCKMQGKEKATKFNLSYRYVYLIIYLYGIYTPSYVDTLDELYGHLAYGYPIYVKEEADTCRKRKHKRKNRPSAILRPPNKIAKDFLPVGKTPGSSILNPPTRWCLRKPSRWRPGLLCGASHPPNPLCCERLPRAQEARSQWVSDSLQCFISMERPPTEQFLIILVCFRNQVCFFAEITCLFATFPIWRGCLGQ